MTPIAQHLLDTGKMIPLCTHRHTLGHFDFFFCLIEFLFVLIWGLGDFVFKRENLRVSAQWYRGESGSIVEGGKHDQNTLY